MISPPIRPAGFQRSVVVSGATRARNRRAFPGRYAPDGTPDFGLSGWCKWTV